MIAAVLSAKTAHADSKAKENACNVAVAVPVRGLLKPDA
jgi:hypothetical protein